MTLAAVLCCAMTTTVFTACGSDDDDKNNTNPPVDNTPVAVLMNYEVGTTQATLSIVDVTIEYYDADGKIQNEPLTEEKWQKTIQQKLPTTAGMHLKAQLKAGFDVENSEEVQISFTRGFNGYTIDATGNRNTFPVAENLTTNISTKSKRFPDWLAEGRNNILPVLFIFDAKGQYTNGTWK